MNFGKKRGTPDRRFNEKGGRSIYDDVANDAFIADPNQTSSDSRLESARP
jgi:hypothetical protein